MREQVTSFPDAGNDVRLSFDEMADVVAIGVNDATALVVRYTRIHTCQQQPQVYCTFSGVYGLTTYPFNGPLSGTTRVSRYQKGKPIYRVGQKTGLFSDLITL